MAEYAHPETLVSTDWVAQHANDALLQSNTNAVTLAALALQTGEDVAAVAIPTYAANAIVDRPADLAAIDATAASQPPRRAVRRPSPRARPRGWRG